MRDREDQVQPSDRLTLLRNSLRLGTGKAEALLNLIQSTANKDDAYIVQTGRTSVVVSGGEMKCVSCSVKTDLKENTEVIFDLIENLSLDEKLKVTSQLVNLSRSSRINVYMRNTTHHDTTIPARTVIGCIQRITDCFLVYPEKHPINAVLAENSHPSPESQSERFQSESQDQWWDPPVNLDHLRCEQ